MCSNPWHLPCNLNGLCLAFVLPFFPRHGDRCNGMTPLPIFLSFFPLYWTPYVLPLFSHDLFVHNKSCVSSLIPGQACQPHIWPTPCHSPSSFPTPWFTLRFSQPSHSMPPLSLHSRRNVSHECAQSEWPHWWSMSMVSRCASKLPCVLNNCLETIHSY